MHLNSDYTDSVTVNGFDKQTVISYIEEAVKSAKCNKPDTKNLRYSIKQIKPIKLGSITLQSFEIKFSGQTDLINSALKQFKKMTFRAGG